jgi:acyl carrier protein
MPANNDKFIAAFQEALGIPAAEITDSLAYNSRDEWDSVAHMVLVAALEETFDIMLDTDDVIGLSSVAVGRDILRKHGVDFAA